MATNKFLKRIVTPDIAAIDVQEGTDAKHVAAALHDYTHGIHGDPITLFGLVFSGKNMKLIIHEWPLYLR